MTLTAQQVERRREGVTASEVAAIVGIHPHMSALDVWRSKVEPAPFAETKELRRGRMLERAVLDWYEEETGHALWRAEALGTIAHAQRPLILATPDSVIHVSADDTPGGTPVEAKTARLSMASLWGESGTDHVPLHYYAQVTIQMAVLAQEQAHLACLLGGDDLRIYPLRYDPDFAVYLMDAGERFFRDYVMTRTPPPPGYGERDHEWLSQRYREYAKTLRPATPQEEALMRALAVVDAQHATLTKTRDGLINLLRDAIGPSEGLHVPGLGTVTWKQNRASKVTDWEAAFLTLAADTVDKKRADLIVRAHTKPKPGPRVFRSALTE